MDVQTIAQRARLPVRKVRYILDQHILPGLRGRLQTHRAGRPRFFTEREGYLIALAALLLEGGVQRRTVTQVLARLADLPWPLPETRPPPPRLKERVLPQPRTLLEAMYLAPLEPAEFLVGDGVNLRLRLWGVDTGWVEPRSLARLEDAYRPWVTILFDLGLLQSAFGQPSLK